MKNTTHPTNKTTDSATTPATLAVVKAKFANAVCVLGSATPGVRTFYNARTKKYAHLELTKRVNDKPLPRIDIIDMKAQKEMHGKAPILSDALIAAIDGTLSRKEQALLFLNKRGFDTFLVCGDCGYNFRCPNCAVALKSHLAENLVKCHYCDYTQKAMPLCPQCRGQPYTQLWRGHAEAGKGAGNPVSQSTHLPDGLRHHGAQRRSGKNSSRAGTKGNRHPGGDTNDHQGA
ncbi:MAG: hypothetical protein MZV70_26775 [Desulfobacterales bacterium]|nr:hypothetical protein [Desulfobacterales bacterium]